MLRYFGGWWLFEDFEGDDVGGIGIVVFEWVCDVLKNEWY